jgi:hypothetical protein
MTPLGTLSGLNEPPELAGRRTIPFDYAFRYELTGKPGNVINETVTVSIEAPFAAVSIGYGIVPKVTPTKFGPEPELSRCIDFRSAQTGLNPRNEQGVVFFDLDSTGQPAVNTVVTSSGQFRGLSIVNKLIMTLRSTTTAIDLTLVRIGTATRVEAFNRNGTIIGTVIVNSFQQAETLPIRGTEIDRVVVTSNGGALLLKFCREIALVNIPLGDVLNSLEKKLEETSRVLKGETGPEAVLKNGFKLNPDIAEFALQNGGNIPLDPSILRNLLQVVAAPPENIQFLYAIFDEASGREFQSEPILNIAGLGISNGDRPFRYFAKPIVFAPQSTIRMEVREVSDSQGELHVALHGYKVLGGVGTPTGRVPQRAGRIPRR